MKLRSWIFEYIQLDSIERRLSAIAVLFIMGTAVTMGCMGIWLTHKFVMQRFHDNFIVLAEYLASNAELGVLLKNKDMLQNLTTNMLEQHDIVKVLIKDDKKNIIAGTYRSYSEKGGEEGNKIKQIGDISYSYNKRAIDELAGSNQFDKSEKLDGSDELDANELDAKKIISSAIKIETEILQIQPDKGEIAIYDTNSTINSDTETIGYVELYYTPSGLRALTKEMTILFMVISFVLSFVSLAWYWFFARSITSPLINLVAVSRKVSQGDLDVKAYGGELRETKTLAKVFNEMLNSVKTHQQETEKMHIEMAKQKSLAEIGKFSTMVAHELKNPISIIKGSIDILKRENLDHQTRETMIIYVDEEIQRLNRLVDEFLMFAKPKTPVLSRIGMSAFLHEVTEKLRFTNPEKRIKISLNVEDAVVECDGILMERALLNILKNAVEHSYPNSLPQDTVKYNELHFSEEENGAIYDAYIEVNGKSQLQGTAYLIEINDRGKGIDEAIIDDIFNPFFTTRAKGTGLGLAIVKEIVAVHNGTVVVRNRRSGGASFQINILTHSVPSFFLKQ